MFENLGKEPALSKKLMMLILRREAVDGCFLIHHEDVYETA